MYSEETISLLNKRISWADAQESSFVIEIDEDNLEGTSGRKLNSFHQLVTVENVLAAVPDPSINAEDFNKVLSDFREHAVRAIMPLILDKNIEYKIDTDYSNTIEDNLILFDDAIGYKTAMMVLEMFISTKRSNLSERNAKLAVSNLKLELEGFRNDTGILVASGLVQKLDKAIRKAANKLFPIVPIVTSKSIW